MYVNFKIRVSHLIVGVVLLSSMLWAGIVLAGEPDSSGEPSATSSYSLADLYQRLNAGTVGSSSIFTEPTTAPGTGTMHSINDIMGKAPALDNTNGATPTQVISGTTFWGLTSGEWGVQTGTLEIAPCDCTGGTLNGTRWCDNGDGTVTDLLGDSSNNNSGQCLVWLQDASWGGQKKWVDSSTWDDAQTRAGTLVAGTGVVTDSSVEGDWRLPTKIELNGLANSGTEDVRTGEVRAFTGIQVSYYWSSTTFASDPSYAWDVTLFDGDVSDDSKALNSYYVWPVRGGQ